MKGHFASNSECWQLVAAGLLAACRGPARRVSGFPSPRRRVPLLVSNSLTYTISVTNLNQIPLTDTLVTNLLSAPFQFVSATGPQGTYTTSSSNVVFDLGSFFDSYFQVAQLTVTVQPTTTGSFTNTVTVRPITVTNTTSTNVVVLVTNAVTLADLGVTMTGPAQPVITNDWMTYGVTVTNAGPNAAPGVILTNTLPPGVGFLSASPAGLAPAVAGSNVIFNLGTLAAGAAVNFLLTVQPTNADILTFSSFVISPIVTDTNTANNFGQHQHHRYQLPSRPVGGLHQFRAKHEFPERPARTNHYRVERRQVAGNRGACRCQRFDQPTVQRRRHEQRQSVRDLWRVSGGPRSVNLLLQYFPRRSFPFTNGQLQAFAVPAPNWTPPAATVGRHERQHHPHRRAAQWQHAD